MRLAHTVFRYFVFRKWAAYIKTAALWPISMQRNLSPNEVRANGRLFFTAKLFKKTLEWAHSYLNFLNMMWVYMLCFLDFSYVGSDAVVK